MTLSSPCFLFSTVLQLVLGLCYFFKADGMFYQGCRKYYRDILLSIFVIDDGSFPIPFKKLNFSTSGDFLQVGNKCHNG